MLAPWKIPRVNSLEKTRMLGKIEGRRRRERLSTSVFWPREFHRLYSPWVHKESDTTEQLSLSDTILGTVHIKLNKEIPAFKNFLFH